MNRCTLTFREREKEKLYHQDLDLGFTTAMSCSLFLLMLTAALQVRAHTFKCLKPFFLIFSIVLDFNSAAYSYSVTTLSDRFYLDLFDSHAFVSGSTKVDFLGFSTKFYSKNCHNYFYNYFIIFCWTSQCGEFWFTFVVNIFFILFSVFFFSLLAFLKCLVQQTSHQSIF